MASSNPHSSGASTGSVAPPVERNSVRHSVELQLAPATVHLLQTSVRSLRRKAAHGFAGIDFSCGSFTNQTRRDVLDRLRQIEDEAALIRDLLLDLPPAEVEVPETLAQAVVDPSSFGPGGGAAAEHSFSKLDAAYFWATQKERRDGR